MNFRDLLVNAGLAFANMGAKYDPTGIASKLIDAYAKRREQNKLKAEFEAMLAAEFERFREELAGAMADNRLQLADGVRAQVEAYLSQFQASARRVARLLGAPSATTVPATVSLDSAAELAAFLPQRAPLFTVGARVPGLPSWQLVEPLGCGGFGEVWKAQHEDDGSLAAFKFYTDPTARGRFTSAEARVIKEIHQKAPTTGVVKLLQVEARQDPPWLQFECVEGGDLSRLPEVWQGLPAHDRIRRVRAAVLKLAETVGHFHNLGVIHRDLKPSNVLLRADGSLVIADFGISKIVPAAGTSPTPPSASLATVRAYTDIYASPQQKKFLPADRRDDVYALGVLWYQLLRGDMTLGRPGGEGWKRALANLGVPGTDIALINRCWDDEPALRPADGNNLAAEMKQDVPNDEAEPRPPQKPLKSAISVSAASDSPKKEVKGRRWLDRLILAVAVVSVVSTERFVVFYPNWTYRAIFQTCFWAGLLLTGLWAWRASRARQAQTKRAVWRAASAAFAVLLLVTATEAIGLYTRPKTDIEIRVAPAYGYSDVPRYSYGSPDGSHRFTNTLDEIKSEIEDQQSHGGRVYVTVRYKRDAYRDERTELEELSAAARYSPRLVVKLGPPWGE